ncbi:hypothetical protein WDY66_00965 [Dermacoccus nishinomiyaensis]|uniref:hypothetical protein n=1 Tax=Dermacoccus nishinomiyaensis TaxID=1274 RepID=UPI00093C5E0F|nr:hypothetical protein [Dermacoccus nishinomiyaensis]
MNNLNTVFWILMTISAVGIVAFFGVLATWGAQIVKANRPVRLERHESIPSYYGRMVAAH